VATADAAPPVDLYIRVYSRYYIIVVVVVSNAKYKFKLLCYRGLLYILYTYIVEVYNFFYYYYSLYRNGKRYRERARRRFPYTINNTIMILCDDGRLGFNLNV